MTFIKNNKKFYNFYGTGIYNKKLEYIFDYMKSEFINYIFDIGEISRENSGEIGIFTVNSFNSFNTKSIAKDLYSNLIKQKFNNINSARSSTEKIELHYKKFELNEVKEKTVSLKINEIMFYYDWLNNNKKNLLKWYGKEIINELVGKPADPFIEEKAELLNKKINSVILEFAKNQIIISNKYSTNNKEYNEKMNELNKIYNTSLNKLKNEFSNLFKN